MIMIIAMIITKIMIMIIYLSIGVTALRINIKTNIIITKNIVITKH